MAARRENASQPGSGKWVRDDTQPVRHGLSPAAAGAPRGRQHALGGRLPPAFSEPSEGRRLGQLLPQLGGRGDAGGGAAVYPGEGARGPAHRHSHAPPPSTTRLEPPWHTHTCSCATRASLGWVAGEKEHDRVQPTYAPAARRDARGCQPRCADLFPRPPPFPPTLTHKGQRAHTMDGVPDCALASCAPSSLYSRSPFCPSSLTRPPY